MTTISYVTPRTDADGAERFIDGLEALSREDWLTVACDAGQDSISRSVASLVLDALIAANQLGFEAWNITDDVDTAVYCADPHRSPSSRRETLALRSARKAAQTAALAVFLRPLLTARDFDVLYRPFASLLPDV